MQQENRRVSFPGFVMCFLTFETCFSSPNSWDLYSIPIHSAGFGPWETQFRRLWKPNALARAPQRLPSIKEVQIIVGWAWVVPLRIGYCRCRNCLRGVIECNTSVVSLLLAAWISNSQDHQQFLVFSFQLFNSNFIISLPLSSPSCRTQPHHPHRDRCPLVQCMVSRCVALQWLCGFLTLPQLRLERVGTKVATWPAWNFQ